MLGVSIDTVVNWEKDKTKPVAAQLKPVVALLGYDPTPEPQTLAERLAAKQRSLGASLAQVARRQNTRPWRSAVSYLKQTPAFPRAD